MIDTGDTDVFLGLDAGKGEHHATTVTPAGKATHRRPAYRGTQRAGRGPASWRRLEPST
ncbi:hypothetical protein OG894_41265 [Streptomyces sp. NBC_01724]|uniref:hypothetical protein n=1 Tax=unclassified Streptomyces TaxID=2593676 RepID=UPI0028C441AC|nr:MULTISPECIES: hypothetical protein [unclassified Streptomyces]WNO70097.1 hypothetical protein RPQ02_00290 [Streptomyces sp. AM2-3-1]WNO70113.1 hypothetical protein RPQ02_40485 [Streptomyces sp. AM2-3-1]WTE49326.1 hypothetical protein OG987_00530 [Streptomyces sp. NBC_01620]